MKVPYKDEVYLYRFIDKRFVNGDDFSFGALEPTSNEKDKISLERLAGRSILDMYTTKVFGNPGFVKSGLSQFRKEKILGEPRLQLKKDKSFHVTLKYKNDKRGSISNDKDLREAIFALYDLRDYIQEKDIAHSCFKDVTDTSSFLIDQDSEQA